MDSSSLMYKPIHLYLTQPNDYNQFVSLTEIPNVQIFDTILDQIKELIKLRNPHKKLTPEEYQSQTQILLNGLDSKIYGTWIYYPWSRTLVHTLSKDEFIEVRTSRNQYKITAAERDYLAQRKIGVIGLSVGQSIALTLVIERVCGEIRLADFDTLELSNLNRLRSGIQNLGIPKVIIAAREIAEIDPYIHVSIFPEGLTDENIESFFGTENTQLDLLVEVCDGLDMKIKSRYHAKKLRIPVVMDTNDRGMLDIERFDLEPERPILHGLAGDLNPVNIKGLTNEEKIPYILKMVGAETISAKLKASMIEVEQTLNTWPQLASSVQLGGAITTDVCRRILLDQLHVSGRFYIDLDELIADEPAQTSTSKPIVNPHQPLTPDQIKTIGYNYIQTQPQNGSRHLLTDSQLNELINIAIAAPSAGNNQPWKWFYNNGFLLLFHDRFRSWSWGDYFEMGAFMGLGTAIESVTLYAEKLGLKALSQFNNSNQYPEIIAHISFEQLAAQSANQHRLLLADHLLNRHTNRGPGTGAPVRADIIEAIRHEISPLKFDYLTDKEDLAQMGQLIAACDRLRLLHPQGHEEFFNEVRWTHDQAQQTLDGIEIASVDLSESDKAGFQVAKDYRAIQYLYEWNLGNAFTKLSVKSMSTASGFGIVSIPDFTKNSLLSAGGNILRAWTVANYHGVDFYPMLSPAFFFNRLNHGNGINLPPAFVTELTQLYKQYQQLISGNEYPIFMFRLAFSTQKPVKTFRMKKLDIYVS